MQLYSDGNPEGRGASFGWVDANGGYTNVAGSKKGLGDSMDGVGAAANFVRLTGVSFFPDGNALLTDRSVEGLVSRL